MQRIPAGHRTMEIRSAACRGLVGTRSCEYKSYNRAPTPHRARPASQSFAETPNARRLRILSPLAFYAIFMYLYAFTAHKLVIVIVPVPKTFHSFLLLSLCYCACLNKLCEKQVVFHVVITAATGIHPISS